eukprot:2390551-Pyramimonas_sp.AAC.1
MVRFHRGVGSQGVSEGNGHTVAVMWGGQSSCRPLQFNLIRLTPIPIRLDCGFRFGHGCLISLPIPAKSTSPDCAASDSFRSPIRLVDSILG